MDESFKMKVTLGITTFNCLDYTKKAVESVQKYIPDTCKLVILDDKSTDGTQDYLDTIPERWNVVLHSINLGCSRSWNDLLKIGFVDNDSDIVFILNNDIILSPNWLESMIAYAKANPDVGIASSNVVGPPDLQFTSFEGWEVDAKERISDSTEEGGQFCCFGVTKNAYRNIGHFDTNFKYTSYEDTDYVVRAYQAGIAVKINNNALAFHYGGVTQNKIVSDEGNSFQQHNKRYFEEKWKVNLWGHICNRAIFWTTWKPHRKLAIYERPY